VKLGAKLASGLHKPDDQTVLPPSQAAAVVAPLPVRALPGKGGIYRGYRGCVGGVYGVCRGCIGGI
jgi:hypothetical protein